MFLAWCAIDEGHWKTGMSRGNGITAGVHRQSSLWGTPFRRPCRARRTATARQVALHRLGTNLLFRAFVY